MLSICLIKFYLPFNILHFSIPTLLQLGIFGYKYVLSESFEAEIFRTAYTTMTVLIFATFLSGGNFRF